MSPATTTSIRLPEHMLARADALIGRLPKREQALASGMVRSDVLRLALSMGLTVLEREAER